MKGDFTMKRYYEARTSYDGKSFYVCEVFGMCSRLVRWCKTLEDAQQFANVYNNHYNLKK